VEPGAERGIPAKAGERAERLDRGLLHDIVHLVAAADQAADKGSQLRVVLAQDAHEGHMVSTSRRSQQVGIRPLVRRVVSDRWR